MAIGLNLLYHVVTNCNVPLVNNEIFNPEILIIKLARDL